jgi:hypothetical protein
MRQPDADNDIPPVILKITSRTLTPLAFAESRRALRTIVSECERTAKAAKVALRNLDAAASRVGVKGSPRALEGLSAATPSDDA